MEFKETIYIVHEDTAFEYFLSGRYDVGLFYVEEKNFNGIKDFMKFCSECCENFIDENIFFDEKIANRVALQQTIKKLNNVWAKEERE